MKELTEKEFEELPHGVWLECAQALPPVGWEVVVKRNDGQVTALTRFMEYEGSPPDQGYWDNNYPGKGNLHIFTSVVSWRKLPSPDITPCAKLAAVIAQRDELLAALKDFQKSEVLPFLVACIDDSMSRNNRQNLALEILDILERLPAIIAKCEANI